MKTMVKQLFKKLIIKNWKQRKDSVPRYQDNLLKISLKRTNLYSEFGNSHQKSINVIIYNNIYTLRRTLYFN